MKILAAISFGLAVAVSCLLLIVPTYSVTSSESPVVRHATLLEVNGPQALFSLAIPVLIALVPVLIPKCLMRIISGLLLAAFVVLGGFTIGLFYFPSAFLMLMAGLLSAPVRKR
ncbi:MAG: hypothetical protein LAP39_30410 [Acidobacteriia bacterium]|nr:hypothetical protein [Terriglobia bacterium]